MASKLVCFISVEDNDNELIKEVLNNIKDFNKINSDSKIKYSICKKAYKTETSTFTHIYFKIASSLKNDFKEIQPKFSISKYDNKTKYACSDEAEIEKIKKIQDCFVHISFNEDDNTFLFQSRTIENSHNYLVKRLFIENKITYNLKSIMRVDSKSKKTIVDDSIPV